MDIRLALAANVQKLRLAKGYSQDRLAQRAEMPRSTIAHLESGSGNPSLENLAKLAAALQVSIEELLATPRSACQLIKAADIPCQQFNAGDIRIYDLLPERVRGLEIVRLELAPGATRRGNPHLPGTKEYLHGIQGCVSMIVAGDLHAVEQGDVLAFAGDQAHSYVNRGAKHAIAVSIVVPVPVGSLI